MLYSSVLPQQQKLGGGRKVEKVPPPYYCTSAGHHILGKKCVFLAGSFLKKSVFKAGTTVNEQQEGRTLRVIQTKSGSTSSRIYLQLQQLRKQQHQHDSRLSAKSRETPLALIAALVLQTRGFSVVRVNFELWHALPTTDVNKTGSIASKRYTPCCWCVSVFRLHVLSSQRHQYTKSPCLCDVIKTQIHYSSVRSKIWSKLMVANCV